MVKTSAALPLLLVALLTGCSGRGIVALHPETLRFANGASGGGVSLALAGDTVLGIFSNRSTATLDAVQVPVAGHLPAAAAVQVVDVVDVAPPLSTAFGRHVLYAAGGTAALLYEDRVASDTTVLKVATRPPGSDQWVLDTLEPSGEPIAVLPSASGSFDVFWAAGPLLWRSPPGSVNSIILPAFSPAGTPGSFGKDGFTAYDAISRSLYVIERTGGGFGTRRLAESGPVQSSLQSADGALSILSWDGATRRLVLLEDALGERGPRRSTVTLCDGTTSVALLPGPEAGTYLFLFDESRRAGGRQAHKVSLIAPAAAFLKPGTRYRKAILFESEQAIDGFAAVETADALYVLVQSRGMTLIRAPIRGAVRPVS